ncbi:endonuclease III [Limisalsivibrio acetivorans]|uniref:endonuclease III n=1 Tax=Limisalsivibrio acetivorans TaxID=1304888 RepID=UPI0003B5E871|nr:endonuclease III [Limisalsivibrio acetivorans]
MEGLRYRPLDREQRAEEFIRFLDENYAGADCSLRHDSPFTLLTATILSAQCTDARVNIVTETLFKKYPTPADLADADIGELMEDIRSTGFYKNKAKSLKGMAGALIEKHGGEVPDTMEELTALPGVGRKTANVILGNCFAKPAIVVDTHVKRISNRLGLVQSNDPDKIEKELYDIIPGEKGAEWSHQVILFGRETCTARKPKCSECPIAEICPYLNGEL